MATKRSYGEACRFAHALDLVGERWALLVVRELLLGPKRFTDLRAGLPHASSNILSERLRDLEQGGVIQRRKLPSPAGSSVYELTEWGRELEPIVTKLGAWGARSPFPPDSQEIGPDSIVLALRSLFDADAAGDLEATYELRIGEERFRVEIADEELDLIRGTGGRSGRHDHGPRRRPPSPRSSPASSPSTTRSPPAPPRSRAASRPPSASSASSRCPSPAMYEGAESAVTAAVLGTGAPKPERCH